MSNKMESMRISIEVKNVAARNDRPGCHNCEHYAASDNLCSLHGWDMRPPDWCSSWESDDDIEGVPC